MQEVFLALERKCVRATVYVPGEVGQGHSYALSPRAHTLSTYLITTTFYLIGGDLWGVKYPRDRH
jgi:hypothetical protein